MAVPEHGYGLKGQRLLPIYPCQSGYCDTCAQIKEHIHGIQTTLKRKRQSGSATEAEHKQMEADNSNGEEDLVIHRQHSSKVWENCNDMTIRSKEQW